MSWGWIKWLGTELDEDGLHLPEGFRRGHRLQRRGGPVPHRNTSRRKLRSRARDLIAPGAKACTSSTTRSCSGSRTAIPIVWKNKDAKPKLCFMGCPAYDALKQLKTWTERVEAGAAKARDA